ncbi:hypothetical protein L228DRAFT_160259 [Xylona heveae TC161]|uniref:Uncharacterized protein n=1 Tax=Xylona heveae (strain CBS 132557 / TC161) TaxID=1328760 RepID=A0A165G6N9_XYLHT|nr:hypothetical protein L228DRAFT_160259 [Xylona heveae TC161]KZF21801.1 hypothetical protein L228DRAFT_160259 [Xylona heveae TC161]
MEAAQTATPENLSEASLFDDKSTESFSKEDEKGKDDGLVIEEVEEDSNNVDTSAEHIHPDHYEEVEEVIPSADESVRSVVDNNGIVGGLRKLSCDDDTESQSEQERRDHRRRKRGNTGLFKRSHSQSVGSSADVDVDALDDHDVRWSARRLRRRVRGPDERVMMSFEGIATPIMGEVEEPASESSKSRRRSLNSSSSDRSSPALSGAECAMELDSGS